MCELLSRQEGTLVFRHRYRCLRGVNYLTVDLFVLEDEREVGGVSDAQFAAFQVSCFISWINFNQSETAGVFVFFFIL